MNGVEIGNNVVFARPATDEFSDFNFAFTAGKMYEVIDMDPACLKCRDDNNITLWMPHECFDLVKEEPTCK